MVHVVLKVRRDHRVQLVQEVRLVHVVLKVLKDRRVLAELKVL